MLRHFRKCIHSFSSHTSILLSSENLRDGSGQNPTWNLTDQTPLIFWRTQPEWNPTLWDRQKRLYLYLKGEDSNIGSRTSSSLKNSQSRLQQIIDYWQRPRGYHQQSALLYCARLIWTFSAKKNFMRWRSVLAARFCGWHVVLFYLSFSQNRIGGGRTSLLFCLFFVISYHL